MFRKTALAAMLAVAAPAYADLQLVGPVDLNGTGLGAVETILTLQAKGQSTDESGSVVAAGAGQQVTGDTIAINQLRTFGELAITDASQIGIVFNTNESQSADKQSVTLNSLQMQIYGPDTSDLIFATGQFGPQTFDSIDPGIGNAGYLFTLDQPQRDAVNSLLAAVPDFSGYRIGLSASLSNADGGPETFFAANVIPEPSTYAMLAAGLLAIGGIARRRMKS